MKHNVLILLLAASTTVAIAQTPAKPAAPAAKPATTAAKPGTTATGSKAAVPAAKAAPVTPPTVAAFIKAPANIPTHKGIQKPLFTVALRYQDIKVGNGAVAEPDKLYKVLYTGYRASDGVKFDSTDDHPRPPVLGQDGKPVMGPDGKPKQGPPQPISFPQGEGRTIIGFDQGFTGMKIGGERRIFIPWQLGYGTRAIPDRGPEHPGIPAKSDLIFDVTLVDVTDIPKMPEHPPMPPGGMRPMPGGHPMPPGTHPAPGAPAATPAAPAKPATATPATTPAAPATPSATSAPAAAPATPAASQPK